jgi:hypothetical protein
MCIEEIILHGRISFGVFIDSFYKQQQVFPAGSFSRTQKKDP